MAIFGAGNRVEAVVVGRYVDQMSAPYKVASRSVIGDLRLMNAQHKINAIQMSLASKRAQAGLSGIAFQAQKAKVALGSLGAVFGVTFGVSVIGASIKSLFDLGVQLEQLDRKATVVLGKYRDEIEQVAETTATSLGLTSREFVNATTNTADLLVPLGFSRQRAAALALELTKLSGATAEWDSQQRGATFSSEVLTKAILGETEQLKQLGIKIDQESKSFNQRVKQLEKTQDLTLGQARALDFLNQITEKSADAQKLFIENQGSQIRILSETRAEIRKVREELALMVSRFADISRISEAIFSAVAGVVNLVKQAAIAISGLWEAIVNRSFGQFTKVIQTTLDNVTGTVQSVWDEIKNAFNRDIEVTSDDFAGFSREAGGGIGKALAIGTVESFERNLLSEFRQLKFTKSGRGTGGIQNALQSFLAGNLPDQPGSVPLTVTPEDKKKMESPIPTEAWRKDLDFVELGIQDFIRGAGSGLANFFASLAEGSLKGAKAMAGNVIKNLGVMLIQMGTMVALASAVPMFGFLTGGVTGFGTAAAMLAAGAGMVALGSRLSPSGGGGGGPVGAGSPRTTSGGGSSRTFRFIFTDADGRELFGFFADRLGQEFATGQELGRPGF